MDRIIEKESLEAIFNSKFKKIVVREEEREDKNQKSVKALICVLARVTCREKNRFLRLLINSLRIDLESMP